MLFEERSLRSVYDFGMMLPEEDANLTSLSKEIWRITQLLYTAWKAGEKQPFVTGTTRDNCFMWTLFMSVRALGTAVKEKSKNCCIAETKTAGNRGSFRSQRRFRFFISKRDRKRWPVIRIISCCIFSI